MSQITAKDEMRAALHRLRVAEGYGAVEALLAKVGVASVNQVSDDAYAEVMAGCPALPTGQGIMAAAAAGDKKPSAAATLDEMGRSRNEAAKDNEIGDGIKEAIANAPTLQEGLSNAARALHVRNRKKAAK
jgi:hypothetical protein